MNEQMRVMVAVDGSIYSAAAVSDLRRAGLPPRTEVRVVSVADTINTPVVSEFDLVSLASVRPQAVIGREFANREFAHSEAQRHAAEAADVLKSELPEMKVSHEALEGKPENELLRVAWEWEPDLIVTGSHGHSTLKRLLLGSVSTAVADKAEASVRIVPKRFEQSDTEGAKLLIGVRGTMDAEHVVDVLKERVWSDGTQIRMMVIDEFARTGEDPTVDELAQYQEIARTLSNESTHVSVDIRTGDPEFLLLSEAESWHADSIFIPASTLGRIAAGLAARFVSPVEVVR